jgi:hypothetical protein
VIVLTVILPKANWAKVIPAALRKGLVFAARASVPNAFLGRLSDVEEWRHGLAPPR